MDTLISLFSLQNSEISFGRTKVMAPLEKFFCLRKGLVLMAKKILAGDSMLNKALKIFH